MTWQRSLIDGSDRTEGRFSFRSGPALRYFDLQERRMREVRLLEGSVPYESLALNDRHVFRYHVTESPDGNPLWFPLNVIVGDSRRPRVVCVAGIHGDEPSGIAALLELWDELSPAELAGTVAFIPVANVPAFRARERRSPIDSLDMNRSFPGDRTGSVTEQAAAGLIDHVVDDADLVLSMHSMGDDSITLPYVEYSETSPVADESRIAAEAFGCRYVDPFEWPSGLLSEVCSERGIPTIEPEIGGLGATSPEYRSRYRRGVRNVLRHLDIVSGKPDAPEDIEMIDREKLSTTVGGVVRHHVKLGESVERGEMLATISDFTGSPVDEITTTTDGKVGEQRRTVAVHPGERVCTVFSPGRNSNITRRNKCN